jgi:phosphatidate cytidylyltransferase
MQLFYFSYGVDNLFSPYLKLPLWVSSLFWIMIVPMIMRKQLTFSLQKYSTSLAIIGFVVFLADWYAIVMLRNEGLFVLLSVLMLVWVADIGAYIFGKQFGKHKLAVQLSPGKSIEGALGGMFCVVSLALFFVYLGAGVDSFFSRLSNQFSLGFFLGIILFLTSMSIIGDLFESQLKRLSGVKDSSGLLPGHGGVLDRMDALLPVLPMAALLLQSF